METGENGQLYTRYHWAKSKPRDGYPKQIHLLEHHLADVGACFEALLAQPTIRQRLARAGKLDTLDEATAARLCVFAALHDIGKVNVGFQTQVWRGEDFSGGRRPPAFRGVGHTKDMVPVLNEHGDRVTSEWFFPALGFDEMLNWDNDDGLTVCALFVAALSHHGSPLNLSENLRNNTDAWRRYQNLDPAGVVHRISQLASCWFPKAWEPGGQPLPSAPEFQHHFLGLCILADWIGSNDKLWFQYLDRPNANYMAHAQWQAEKAMKDIGLDIAEQRSAFKLAQSGLDFNDLFKIDGAPPPKAIQRQAALETPLEEQLVIIESETGSGKTEAALWRFAKMYERELVDGLYFALPTRPRPANCTGGSRNLSAISSRKKNARR